MLIYLKRVTKFVRINAYASEFTLHLEPILNGRNSLQLSQGKNPTFKQSYDNLYEPKTEVNEVDIWVQECEGSNFIFPNFEY